MNNNYNQNGQFGGGGQYGANPYNTNNGNNYYGAPYGYRNGYTPPGYGASYSQGNPITPLQQEKINDRKIIRTIGTFVAIAVLLYIGLSSLFGVIIGILSEHFPKIGMFFDNTLLNYAYGNIASVLFIALPFFAVHLILRKKRISGILPMGTTYNKKASISLVMMLFPVVIITSMVINLISFAFQSATGIEFSGGYDEVINGPAEIAMSVISVAVLPAVVEEIAIRGIVLQPLRRYGDWFAIIASSLIFSLMHGNMVQIPYTLAAGIIFGIVAVSTGSLWPSIVLHFLNNLFSVLILCADSNFSETAANFFVFIMLGVLVLQGIAGGVIFFTMRYRPRFAKGVKTLNNGEKANALFGNPVMIAALVAMVLVALTSISF